MKNSVNNQPASNNVVNFAIANNPQSAYKYIKRETLIEDYHTLILGCSKANVEVEAIANPDQISKKSLIDSYVTIAQKYMEVVTVQEEPVAEEAPVETIQVQEEVKVEDPTPKAEKKTKEESGESKGHRVLLKNGWLNTVQNSRKKKLSRILVRKFAKESLP